MHSASLSLLKAMEKGDVIVWHKNEKQYKFLDCMIKNHIVRDLIFVLPACVTRILEDETQTIYTISKYGKERLDAL